VAYEVELKFEVVDRVLLENFLRDCLRQGGEVHTVDVYFDRRDAALFRRGIFIRVRDGRLLEFKFNPKDFKHEFAVERSFELPLREDKVGPLNQLLSLLGMRQLSPGQLSLQSLLKLNDLHEFVRIEKTRTVFVKEPFTFSLDDVRNLGQFIEIECHTDEEAKVHELISIIKGLAEKLKLKPINVGYVELYLRKYNYELYKQGLYILDADKPKLA
jgi:adenylate cyclase class IV